MANIHESRENLNIVREESAGVVALNGDDVLVVRHEKFAKPFWGHYGLPSGRKEIKPNGKLETFRETALREFREETGLAANPESLIDFPHPEYSGLFPLKTGPIWVMRFEVFLVTDFTGELRGEDGKTTPEWVNIRKFNLFYPTTVPGILTAIQRGVEFRRNLTVAKP